MYKGLLEVYVLFNNRENVDYSCSFHVQAEVLMRKACEALGPLIKAGSEDDRQRALKSLAVILHLKVRTIIVPDSSLLGCDYFVSRICCVMCLLTVIRPNSRIAGGYREVERGRVARAALTRAHGCC